LLRSVLLGKIAIVIPDIRKLIAAQPFVPFTIHSADGSEVIVPTVDHIAVPPAGSRVFVFGDADDYEVLSGLLISRLSVNGKSASPPKP
jgi:hypothetical protein